MIGIGNGTREIGIDPGRGHKVQTSDTKAPGLQSPDSRLADPAGRTSDENGKGIVICH
jgi:hypothetical protein